MFHRYTPAADAWLESAPYCNSNVSTWVARSRHAAFPSLSEILAGTDAFGVVSGQLLHQALHLLAGSFADRTLWKNASHRENKLMF
jgi:hypothetical protein